MKKCSFYSRAGKNLKNIMIMNTVNPLLKVSCGEYNHQTDIPHRHRNERERERER